MGNLPGRSREDGRQSDKALATPARVSRSSDEKVDDKRRNRQEKYQQKPTPRGVGRTPQGYDQNHHETDRPFNRQIGDRPGFAPNQHHRRCPARFCALSQPQSPLLLLDQFRFLDVYQETFRDPELVCNIRNLLSGSRLERRVASSVTRRREQIPYA